MRSDSLRIDSNTNAAQLQEFAGKLDDGMRLRARKVEGGFELYAKDSKPSLWSRITGRSEETRANAKEAVRTVFANTERNMGGPLLDNAREALNGGMKSKDIKGDALKSLAESVASRHLTTVPDLYGQPSKEAKLENRGPGLDKLPGNLKADLLANIRDELGELPFYENDAGGAEKALVSALRTTFAGADRTDARTDKVLTRLALSSGSGLTFDLRQALGDSFPVLKGEDGRKVLEKVFASISNELLPIREDASHNIPIGGDTFAKGPKLGNGAFGEVFTYTSAATGKSIAVKTFIPDPNLSAEEQALRLDAFKREAAIHLSAQGDGHDNVIKMLGAVRMADGTIGIAMEMAPHKNGADLRSNLAAAVRNGDILPQDAMAMKLTFLREMTAGLAHLHRDGKDVNHIDNKLENVFIGEGGVAKQGDFGLSTKTRKIDLATAGFADHSMQNGPELTRALNDMVEGRLHKVVADSGFDERLKGLTQDERDTLRSDAESARTFNGKRENAGRVDFGAVDMWSMGQAAFKLVFDRDLCSMPNMSGTDRRIMGFGENRSVAIDTSQADANRNDWTTQPSGSFAGSTGNADLDDFLNQTLHSDPGARLKFDAALDHRVFSQPGVDTPRAHALIVALMTDDTATLHALRGTPPLPPGTQPPPLAQPPVFVTTR